MFHQSLSLFFSSSLILRITLFLNLSLCQGLSKQGLVMNQMKAVHFGKSSGRSTPRRSSSRSIKRKKFDDELVESSLKNPPKSLIMPEMDKEKLKKV